MSDSSQGQLTEHILQVVLNEDGTAKVLGNDEEISSKQPTLTDTINLQTFTVTLDDTNSDEGLATIRYEQADEQEIEHELCEVLIVNDDKNKTRRHKRAHSTDLVLNNLEKRRNTHGSNRKKFSRKWLLNPMFCDWLEESDVGGHAHCSVCNRVLLPGKSELIKHANTAKHKRNIFNVEGLLHPSTSNVINTNVKKKIKEEKVTETVSEHIIDLRSESISNQPYRENREFYSFGDDTFREDPSVLELEKYVSELLQKESCLLTINGTSANNICILTHCVSRFSLVIAGSQSYIYKNSQGPMCELGKLSMRHVTNFDDGTFDISELKGILRDHNQYWPTSTLVCVENTHTALGGQPISMDWLNQLAEICSEYGIPIHMDGVRLGNASVALGETMANLVKHCSSVSFHLDKSFSAIGGCIIAGRKEFINKALRLRNTFGYTIPQAGILATSALSSLQNFSSKITRSHANAIALAEVVKSLNSSAVYVNLKEVRTNIVMLKCDNITITPQKLCERLQKIYVDEESQVGERIILKVLPLEPNMVRLVVHSEISLDYLRLAMRKLHYVISESCRNCYVLEYV